MLMSTIDQVLPFNHFKQKTLNPFKNFKKTKKILMVEDDPEISDLITSSLKMRYYCHIDVAQDPFEAMNLITEKFYDLIILDWQLPGLNGAETLVQAEKGLQLEPLLPIQWDQAKVPVVVFTSSKKNDCLPQRTKHFNYVGYVSKAQPLNMVIDALGEFIENDKKYPYLTA